MPRTTNLTEKQYEVFFDILDKIVNGRFGSWSDRKDELVANAGERDVVNLSLKYHHGSLSNRGGMGSLEILHHARVCHFTNTLKSGPQ